MPYYTSTMDVTEAMREVDSQCTSRSGGSSASQQDRLDIFGTETDADKAHLMPHSMKDAVKWRLIVPGLLSGNVRDTSDKKMNMFINGFIKPHDDASKKMRRVNNSGIKNFPTNKIRLARQREYYDMHHCLLIIPILPPASIISWNGDGYEAIVLVAARDKMPDPPARVYKNIGAGEDARDDVDILATPQEIEICRNSLE